jgi:hypothetical protein
MGQKQLESIMAKNLLIDKFAMAMRSNACGSKDFSEIMEALFHSTCDERQCIIDGCMQAAIDKRQWLEVALLAACAWHDDWKEHLGRDFVTEGNEPEHVKLEFLQAV